MADLSSLVSFGSQETLWGDPPSTPLINVSQHDPAASINRPQERVAESAQQSDDGTTQSGNEYEERSESGRRIRAPSLSTLSRFCQETMKSLSRSRSRSGTRKTGRLRAQNLPEGMRAGPAVGDLATAPAGKKLNQYILQLLNLLLRDSEKFRMIQSGKQYKIAFVQTRTDGGHVDLQAKFNPKDTVWHYKVLNANEDFKFGPGELEGDPVTGMQGLLDDQDFPFTCHIVEEGTITKKMEAETLSPSKTTACHERGDAIGYGFETREIIFRWTDV